MSKKVLITGATGFVGACLAEDLVRDGMEVHVIARKTSNSWRLEKIKKLIGIHEVDLCDCEQVDSLLTEIKPENIFHLATYGAYHYQDNWKQTVNTNVIGTMNLMNSALKVDFDSFINIGSSSEYGNKAESMREDMILEPINTYGVTKASAALYGRMLGSNLNRRIATVRLFSVYGYYEEKSRLVPTVILSCLKGEAPALASGDAVRDFIFVKDVIDLIKTVSNSKDICGKIYNAGTGKQHSVADMVNTIISEVGEKIVPKWGTVPGRASDTEKWEADMSLVNKEFAWKPKYSLDEGVKATVDWFRENSLLY